MSDTLSITRPTGNPRRLTVRETGLDRLDKLGVRYGELVAEHTEARTALEGLPPRPKGRRGRGPPQRSRRGRRPPQGPRPTADRDSERENPSADPPRRGAALRR
ncbi:MAG: hypothetical protein IPL07_12865 [Acidimicrobiaceae bacterium]|nr:hypothetical protein [Acidimicrobiaceae bacterium]